MKWLGMAHFRCKKGAFLGTCSDSPFCDFKLFNDCAAAHVLRPDEPALHNKPEVLRVIVVQVYNKKASLLEGDLSETLERLHREVSAPPETLAKASGWPVAVGKSKKAAGCSNDKGAEVTRGRKGFAPEGDTEALEVAGGSEGGVGGGARRK
eukprot:389319-Pelagomonas_calceolata.AAC.1